MREMREACKENNFSNELCPTSANNCFPPTGNTISIIILSGRAGRRRRILSEAYRMYIVTLAVADSGVLIFTAFIR